MRYIKTRKASTNKKVVILQDYREKQPWDFKRFGFDVEVCKLDTGDYTVKGCESVIAIEKKRDLKEFITNLSGFDRNRFKRELERLNKFPFSCIIIEDSINNIKKTLTSIRGTRLGVENVIFWIMKIQLEYQIPIIFTGTKPRVKDFIMCELANTLTRIGRSQHG